MREIGARRHFWWLREPSAVTDGGGLVEKTTMSQDKAKVPVLAGHIVYRGHKGVGECSAEPYTLISKAAKSG